MSFEIYKVLRDFRFHQNLKRSLSQAHGHKGPLDANSFSTNIDT
jgi:hypothetical protein